MSSNRGRGRGSWSRLLGVMTVALALVATLGGTAVAAPGFEARIPIDTVVRAPEGSQTQLASADVPAEAAGQQCSVVSEGQNQRSVHPGNDLVVRSGDSQVVLPNVEDDPGGVVSGDGLLTLSATITVTLDMGPDEVFSGGFDVIIECDPHPGRIIVVKEVAEGSDTSQSFEFTANYDSESFSLAHSEQSDSGDLAPGTYSVSESVPPGWTLVSATCDDGSPVEAIDLSTEEVVTCTFVNEEIPPEPGRIIVVKEVAEGSDTSQSFEFTASYDEDGFALSDGQQNDSGELSSGVYEVSEIVPDGWRSPTSTCDDGSGVDAIALEPGETVTCTFTNQEVPEDTVLASIVVTIAGSCEIQGGTGVGQIAVDVSVDDGADVVVSDAEGNVVGSASSDAVITVEEGETYTWQATPNEGFEFPAGSETSGTLNIETCSEPETLPFTGPETDWLVLAAMTLIGAGAVTLVAVRLSE